MKIGYIILCHKNPELVSREIKCVTEGTNNIAIVHVDAKANIDLFAHEFCNNAQVIFVEKRVDVYWGGFSSIEATMNALEAAIRSGGGCGRYVLLQGCDFPIHSNAYIDAFFEKYKDIEFIRAYNATRSHRRFNYMKCYGYHLYDGVDRSRVSLKSILARALTGFNKLGIKYRRGYYLDEAENKKYEVYWGWAHFAITSNCAKYLIEVYQNNIDLNRYFKHIFPADETYLQTIIYNSDFASKTADGGAVDEKTHLSNESMLNLTYFEYPDSVKVFEKISELEGIDRSKYLYIRKIKNESELEKALSCRNRFAGDCIGTG